MDGFADERLDISRANLSGIQLQGDRTLFYSAKPDIIHNATASELFERKRRTQIAMSPHERIRNMVPRPDSALGLS